GRTNRFFRSDRNVKAFALAFHLKIQSVVGMIFDVLADVAEEIELLAVELENLVSWLQSGDGRGTIRDHLRDDRGLRRANLDLAQAFSLPELRLILGGSGFQCENV